MRRTARRLGYGHVDGDNNPSLALSSAGWNYMHPQNMTHPHVVNRSFAMPYQGRKYNKYPGVWISMEAMDPAIRVALNPYLNKLALTRVVPPTPPAEAVADFTAKGNLIEDVASRDAWLGKVAQLCGLHKAGKDVLPAWTESGCHERYVSGSAVPPAELAKAMVYATSASELPEWKAFFECCLKEKWNLTPHFCHQIWVTLLRCAGTLGDEDAVFMILEEMVDLQVDLDNINNQSIAIALNAITSDAAYAKLKPFMFKFSEAKTQRIMRSYSGLRTRAELEVEGAFKMPVNDKVFYHVHWHSRMRGPMLFNPRQLFFDYQPAASIAGDAKSAKRNVKDLVDDKIKQWKEEGLLPQDYVHTEEVFNKEESFLATRRLERWKKKPTFMEKEKLGHSPGV